MKEVQFFSNPLFKRDEPERLKLIKLKKNIKSKKIKKSKDGRGEGKRLEELKKELEELDREFKCAIAENQTLTQENKKALNDLNEEKKEAFSISNKCLFLLTTVQNDNRGELSYMLLEELRRAKFLDKNLDIRNKEDMLNLIQNLNSSSFDKFNKNLVIVNGLLKSVFKYFNKNQFGFKEEDLMFDNWMKRFSIDLPESMDVIKYENKESCLEEEGFVFNNFRIEQNISHNRSVGRFVKEKKEEEQVENLPRTMSINIYDLFARKEEEEKTDK